MGIIVVSLPWTAYLCGALIALFGVGFIAKSFRGKCAVKVCLNSPVLKPGIKSLPFNNPGRVAFLMLLICNPVSFNGKYINISCPI